MLFYNGQCIQEFQLTIILESLCFSRENEFGTIISNILFLRIQFLSKTTEFRCFHNTHIVVKIITSSRLFLLIDHLESSTQESHSTIEFDRGNITNALLGTTHRSKLGIKKMMKCSLHPHILDSTQ